MATTAIPALVASFGAAAHAGNLPTGGQVIGGAPTINTPSATQMQITSTTARSAISWQDFSIGSGYGVNVTQPNAGSTQLEQVRGSNVSQIFGSLTSNGSIVIANPNGIWFGPQAQVDVAGLAATTAHATATDIQNFMNGGNLNLSQTGNANAAVVNQGHITISNAGLGAFVAPGVRNDGVIAAKLGTVQLSSGTTATLDFYGDGLISIAVTGPTLGQAIDPSTGKPMTAAVNNTGTLNADGGMVLVTANVASNVVNNVINTSGVVQARAVSVEGGQIVLDGGSNGNVQVAGILDASGTGAGQTGGNVQVLGQNVTLAGTAVVDASGDRGGGSIYVGGGPHGQGTSHVATTTTVAKGATIKANAITVGNGGTVAVWSAQFTSFDGTIDAMGGSQGGNGGFVETSGIQLALGGDATVNTSALRGQTGTWLLDPAVPFDIEATGGDETGADVVSQLASTNVVITDPTIIVGDAINSSAQSNSNTLTLDSSTLDLNAAITLGVNQALTGTATTVNVNLGGLIQNAVDAAASGAQVNVAAGTFQGQVSIDKNLTLSGASTAGTTIAATSGLTPSFTTEVTFDGVEPVDAVIGATGGANVTIENLTVDGRGQGGNDQFVGIGADNASLTVSNVHVTNIENTPLSGVQSGIGIGVFNEDNVARSVTLTGNTIDNFQKDGISLQGGSLTVDVENNTVTGAGATSTIGQNGIELLGFASSTYLNSTGVTGTIGGTVAGNVITEIGFTPNSDYATPIYILGANGVTVSGNTVTGTGGNVSAYGISILGSSNVAVENNVLSDLARGISVGDEIDGSFFSGDSSIAISGGSIENSATGVYVDPNYASDVTVSGVSFANNTIHYQGSGTGVPTAADVLANNTFDATATDSTNLPNTIYGSLQTAVNAETAGDTLDLLGTFQGQVSIDKSLTLAGTGGSNSDTTIEAPATLGTSFSTWVTFDGTENVAAVVGVTGGANVTIENLTVDGRGQGGNDQFVGIGADNASLTVSNVHVTNIENTPLSGVQSGIGIGVFNEDNVARSVTLTGNTIDNFQKDGISLQGGSLTVDVENNTVTGAGATSTIGQNGIELLGFANNAYITPAVSVTGSIGGTISSNTVTGIGFTPNTDYAASIYILAANGVNVANNTVTGTGSSVSGYGISVLGSSNVTLQNNTLSNLSIGVSVGDDIDGSFFPSLDTSVGITGNTIQDNAIGIEVAAGSTGTIIGGGSTSAPATLGNLITGNGIGVLVASDAGTGTVLHWNSLAGNTTALENDSTNLVDAAANWWGTTNPTTAQGEIASGGASTGDTFVDFNAMLASGTNNVGAGNPGFEGIPSVIVHTLGATNGVTGRIQEGIDLAGPAGHLTSGGSDGIVTVLAGNYSTENASVDVSLGTLIFSSGSTTLGSLNGVQSSLTEFDGTLNATSVTLGNVYFNGGNVNTTGGQTYDGHVWLGADTTLSDTGVTGNGVTFNANVDASGANRSLTVSGNATFGDAIGTNGAVHISKLLVTGTTDINGGTIDTTSGQVYGGAVTLSADATLNDFGGSAITFDSTVDSDNSGNNYNLTVNTAGQTTFDGKVGFNEPLGSLDISNGATDINGSSITTAGGQTYAGAVTLTNSARLSDSGGNAIVFDSTIDSDSNRPWSLTTSTSGETQFFGNVGVNQPLGILTILGGPAQVEAITIVTTSSQSYLNGIIVANTSGNVILEAGGSIAIDDASSHPVGDYNSTGQLDLLVEGNVTIVNNLENSGSGAVNAVAGWDGSSGLSSGSFSFGDLVAANTSAHQSYGQIGQSLTLDGSSGFAAIGSASGATNVAGYDVAVLGGQANNAYAQIGYHGPANAPITVLAANKVTVAGGSSTSASGSFGGAYAQIGHGGIGSLAGVPSGNDVTLGGDITVTAGGDITVEGGNAPNSGSVTNTGSYGQIGHGGNDIGDGQTFGNVSLTGAITVTSQTGKVSLTTGSGSATSQETYAQIGHGGYDAFHNATIGGTNGATLGGNITVSAGGSNGVLLSGNSGLEAYAQIGHGGDGAFSGAHITTGGLTVGSASNSAAPSVGGLITISAPNGSIGLSSGGAYEYTQIGHGGLGFAENAQIAGNANINGDISVSAGGSGGVYLGAGYFEAYAQIGHGGFDAFNRASITGATGGFGLGGDITVIASDGGVSLHGGNAGGTGAYTQIGHGGYGFASDATNSGSITIDGDITVSAGGSDGVTLQGGNYGAYAQIGHGGEDAFYEVSLTGASGSLSIGDTSANISVTASSGYVSLGGGDAYAQIGHGGLDYAQYAWAPSATIDGNINVSAEGPGGVQLDGEGGYAQIGHGGSYAFAGASLDSLAIGDTSANITVTANGTTDGDIGLFAGDGYVQIGHGGSEFAAYSYGSTNDSIGSALLAGTIDVSSAHGYVWLEGGNDYAFAQIGHGGEEAFAYSDIGTLTIGNGQSISVSGADYVELDAGNYAFAYAQIGDGGALTLYNAGADTVNVTGDISVSSSNGDVTVGGGFDTGYGFAAYTQIGHGGVGFGSAFDFGDYAYGYNASFGDVTLAGNITVNAPNGNVGVYGGYYFASYAQIGHGGALAFASGESPDCFRCSGSGTVSVGSLQIGNPTDTISVTGGDVTVAGGGYEEAYYFYDDPNLSLTYAQIGNGGGEFAQSANYGASSPTSTAAIDGNISVTALNVSGGYTDGQVNVLGGGYQFAYAQIGQGGAFAFEGASFNTLTVDANGETTSVNAYSDVNIGGYDYGYYSSYAQIGNGGIGFAAFSALGSATIGGDINVTSQNGDVYLQGGWSTYSSSYPYDEGGAYAQIGNGGDLAFVGASTTDTLSVGGNVTVTAGNGEVDIYGGYAFADYAQIGNGGAFFGSSAPVFFFGPSISTSFGDVTLTGDVAVNAADGVYLESNGSGSRSNVYAFSYTQIGNGGGFAFDRTQLSSLSVGGDVTVATAGDVYVSGGTDSGSGFSIGDYAQIGNGGAFTAVESSLTSPPAFGGTVTVAAGGELTVQSGNNPFDYAAIGDGDPLGEGVLAGTVDVTSVGDQTYTSFAPGADLILAAGTYGTDGANLNFWDSNELPTTVILSGGITIDNSNTFWGPVELPKGVAAPNMAFNLSGQNTEFSGQVGSLAHPIGNMSISGGDNFTIDPGVEVYVVNFSDTGMTGLVNFGSTLNVSGNASVTGDLSGDLVCAGGGLGCITATFPASGTIDGIPALDFVLATSGAGGGDPANDTLHLFNYQYALSNPGQSLGGAGGINPQAGCSDEDKKENGGKCPAGSNNSEQSSVNFGNQFLSGTKL